LIALLWFDLSVLSKHAWQPEALILERSKNVPLEQGWGIGYDAQWYYAIALDPAGAWQRLDQPAYRYQRIAFPLLVRGLSLRIPSLIPWTMLAINLAAAGLSCYFLGALLARRGASPWLAVIYIFSLGFLLSVRMDLLEPLALCFALAGWLALEEDRFPLAVALFALGALTKEVVLTFPLGLVLWKYLQKDRRRALILAAGVLVPYLGWFLFLRFWLGATPGQIAQSTPAWIPFSGWQFLGDPVSRGLVAVWVLIPAIFSGLAAARGSWPLAANFFHGPLDRIVPAEAGGCAARDSVLVLAQVGLIAFMPGPTWADPLAILRVGLGLMAAVLVWLASTHPRLLPFAAALWLPSGLVLFFVPGLI
jgi:hypothetical protein